MHSTIHTPNLILKPVDLTDLELLHKLRTDAEVCKFFKRDITKTIADTKVFIEERMKTNAHFYSILTKEHQTLIGTITLWNIDLDTQYAEVGYELFPAYQNKGFMSEALVAITSHAFNSLGFKLLEAYTHENNIPSRKLLEKCGFTFIPEKKDPDASYNVIYGISKPA